VATFVALFDACVLHPAPLRDLLLRLAATDLFRARWTDEIHEEWIRSVLAQRADLTREQLNRTRKLMNDAVPDCLVTGYVGSIGQIALPDPSDRHVLEAAIRCQAGVIVTYNVKHFPADVLDPHGVEVQHPDEFISHLFDLAPGAVCAAARDQRLALRKPSRTVPEMLDTFLALGLATTVSNLTSMQELL